MFMDLFIKPVYAQCPVCVVTVGGGLFLAKKLGIDDLLVSIWLSSLNTAIAFWIVSKIKKKILNNGYLWTAIFFVLTVVSLIFTKQIGHIRNTFLGIDKVLFGLTAGLVISVGAVFLDKFLRSKNKGKVFFPYQKVVIPIVLLFANTLIFYRLLIYVRQ
jgi:hypothetical protein